MNLKFFEFKAEKDLCWAFSEGAAPYFSVPEGSWPRQVKVDPFPGYAHDIALVRAEAERTAATFPMKEEVRFATLDREFLERTNGWTNIHHDWDSAGENSSSWSATICFSGKRIPPHPAMTRYLVAHEYGHAVAEHLRRTHGTPTDTPNRKYDENKLYNEYRELRGIVDPKSYGGGWHATTSELFANDFRILVAKSEIEFWPHPGFLRPEELVKVVEFWKREVDALKENSESANAVA